jgi:hypothetical protein
LSRLYYYAIRERLAGDVAASGQPGAEVHNVAGMLTHNAIEAFDISLHFSQVGFELGKILLDSQRVRVESGFESRPKLFFKDLSRFFADYCSNIIQCKIDYRHTIPLLHVTIRFIISG